LKDIKDDTEKMRKRGAYIYLKLISKERPSVPTLFPHFEYLTDSSVSGVKYFDTAEGKLELELYMKMLRHLKTIIV
jgi:hypothetical protein